MPTPSSRFSGVHLPRQAWPWAIVLVGLAGMYGPTFADLLTTIWATEQQGHGPIVLAISCWLLWRQRSRLASAENARPRPVAGGCLVGVAGLLYVLGRSQGVLIFEVGSLPVLLAGVVLVLRGASQLRAVAFGLCFMVFMVPLPSPVVDSLTQPMKIFVSYMAEAVLHAAGYPVSRAGVIISIGPYQLLVADACAGLQTLFTLESLGLLYLNLVRHTSWLRNIGLAILIVPISMAANIIRVVVLALITYHFGDETGQGFLHGFAGMVLFLSALMLIVAGDSALRLASSSVETR